MILHNFEYIKIPSKTNILEADVENVLCANNKYDTVSHVTNVAKVSSNLAEQFSLDKDTCFAAGLLHDISIIIKPEDMLGYALDNCLELCAAERKYPFLLHQRMSKIIAHEYYEITDADILSAIECHTSLKASPNKYDMVLFIADKLAWDQNDTPPFYDDIIFALNESLEKACLVYMHFMTVNNKILYPHTNWTLAYEYLKESVGI